MTWSVHLQDRDGREVAVPGSIALRPLTYGWTAQFGPSLCEIAVDGEMGDLVQLEDWLRYEVVLHDPRGVPVWWGYIDEVRLFEGAIERGVSLENMINDVSVTFVGDGDRVTTEWATDDHSLSIYGRKQELITSNDTTLDAALQRRNDILAARKYPPAIPSLVGGGEGQGGVIICFGWGEALRWQLHSRDEGRQEHMAASHLWAKLGLAAGGGKIAFDEHHSYIATVSDSMALFETDDKIYVSGSASNNGHYTVVQGDNRPARSYSSNAIGFTARKQRVRREYIRGTHNKWRKLSRAVLDPNYAQITTVLYHTTGDTVKLNDATELQDGDGIRIQLANGDWHHTIAEAVQSPGPLRLATTLQSAASNGDTQVEVADASNIQSGYHLRIYLNDSSWHYVDVSRAPEEGAGGSGGDVLYLDSNNPLPDGAGSGAQVWIVPLIRIKHHITGPGQESLPGNIVHKFGIWVEDEDGTTVYDPDWDYYTDAYDGEFNARSDGAITNNQKLYISYYYTEYTLEDTNLGLGFVEPGDIIEVTGVSSNTGLFRVVGADSEGAILVLKQAVVDEEPGNTLTVWRGSRIRVAESLTNEMPSGATTVIRVRGTTIEQDFTVASDADWELVRILLKIRRVGSVWDSVNIRLTDSTTGTTYDATVAGSTIGEAEAWHTWTFDPPVSMVAGRSYSIRIERSAGTADDSYYELAYDEGTGVGAVVLRGADWSGTDLWPFSPGAQLLHQLVGEEPLIEQIAHLVAESAQFLTGVDSEVAAGATQASEQWRAGDVTSRSELVGLLHQGTTTGKRLLGQITPERQLHVFVEPDKGTTWAGYVHPDGRLSSAHGDILTELQRVAGHWVAVRGRLGLHNVAHVTGGDSYLCERAEYDIETGRATATPKEAPALHDIGSVF